MPSWTLDHRRTQAGLLLVAGLLVAAYYQTLVTLVAHWTANDIYSYAFVVPALAGFVVWSKRAQLRAIPLRPSLGSGLALTIAGVLLLLGGRWSGTNAIEELSLVVTIAGLTLLTLGRAMLQALRFPILYLLAMVPIWEIFTSRLHPIFQRYSATLGVEALQLVGVPVFRQGNFIELPNITLEVAEACSGINYLIAVLCVGVPVAYLYVGGWPKRLALVGAAVAIAILSNAVRVASVSLMAWHELRGANGDIHGPFALFRALLVSAVGYVALFALVSRFADRTPGGSPRPLEPPAAAHQQRGLALAMVLAAGVLTSTMIAHSLHRIDAVPPTAAFRALPQNIGPWQARAAASFPNELDAIPFDDRVSQIYRDPDGTEVNVSVGYFRRQTQGRELAGYDLRSLFAARGERSRYSTAQEGARVGDFFTSDGARRYHVTYWYILNGKLMTSDYAAKLQTAWNAAVRAKSHGAIVMIKAPVPAGRSIEAARHHVARIVDAVVAFSRTHVPT